MSKAKFTYDESGATFFYFVLSFLALILVPLTYYLWPYELNGQHSKGQCNCNGCQAKRQNQDVTNKRRRSRKTFIRAIIVIGWLVFALIAYRCATTQNEYVNWDPFEILGVHEGANENDIKKAYRKLSLIYHPDKGSNDPSKFVEISKAYTALTDEEARKNWEQYGNPDGPTFASYGIALPSWIVEKENSFVVLGIYALIFMVALPVSVGAWWYKSMKFGNDKVLLLTSEIFYYHINLTPNMPLKRVIMILTASLEFARSHNPEIIERPSDNQEVPRLIRDIPLVGIEKNKEVPLIYSYSVKARALLHAHLNRMKLPPTTLEVDRCYIVKKCPYLLQEFVHCTSQLITLALAGRACNMPNLFTLENAMKLGSLIVQAMWEYQDPLLQLPHFTKDTLKYMERRKVKVRSIEQLARMKESDRKEALRIFSDSQYDDIKLVIGSMPVVQVECKFEVLDDEDPNVVTAHSIVTATVRMKRVPMRELFRNVQNSNQSCDNDLIYTEKTQHTNETEDKFDDTDLIQSDENESPPKNPSNNLKKRNKVDKSGDDVKNVVDQSDDLEQYTANDNREENWNKKFHEKVIKRQKVFESKPKKSHPVHCPYFPDDKQEYWWVYIVDRKRFALITAPLIVTNLTDTEEVELKFSAPKVGAYSYTVIVRSDSYVDCTVCKDVRVSVESFDFRIRFPDAQSLTIKVATQFEVKPAREYVEEDIPEDELEEDVEDEHSSSLNDSDLLTDFDDD